MSLLTQLIIRLDSYLHIIKSSIGQDVDYLYNLGLLYPIRLIIRNSIQIRLIYCISRKITYTHVDTPG
jgi:hypothetical protein